MDQKIKDKIKKVLALQASPSEEEAAVAAAMAKKLLDEYNLNINDLQDDIDDSTVNGQIVATWNGPGDFGSWAYYLFEKLSVVFDVKPYRTIDRGMIALAIVGMKSDMEIFTYTFGYLYNTVRKMTRDDSYAHGIIDRVLTQVTKFKQEYTTDDHKALIVLKSGQIAQYVERNVEIRGQHSYCSNINKDKYDSGYKAGSRVSIREAIK